jgi:hypothetical protein
MNPIGPAVSYTHNLLAELCKIRCENRGGDDGFTRIHVLFDSVP